MIEELKIKTETYYAMQKIRIQAQLRIKAFVRDERLQKEEAESLHFWLNDQVKHIEVAIKKEIATLLKDVPIWTKFLRKAKGVGPCLAGSLIAGIVDISRFNHVSSLQKYCGMDVVDGEAPRRVRGEKITWNPFLRTACFKLGESFTKQNPDKCQYRRLYDERKPFYRKQHPEWEFCYKCGAKLLSQDGLPDKCSKKGCSGNHGGIPHPTRKKKDGGVIYQYTKDHIHRMTMRWVVKLFIQHLWVEWRKLEGLSISDPWVIAHGGHADLIEPDYL